MCTIRCGAAIKEVVTEDVTAGVTNGCQGNIIDGTAKVPDKVVRVIVIIVMKMVGYESRLLILCCSMIKNILCQRSMTGELIAQNCRYCGIYLFICFYVY